MYQDAGIRVSGFMGHYAPAGGFSSVDVAVCTIEKGNSLINRMLEDNKLDQLGIPLMLPLYIKYNHMAYTQTFPYIKYSYMAHNQTILCIKYSHIQIFTYIKYSYMAYTQIFPYIK
jgi:hypothetical protein